MAAQEQPLSLNESLTEEPTPSSDLNYVKLEMGDVDLNGWSNNPDDMQLDTYFSLDKDVPGLSESFNLPNLKPVIVKVQSDSSGDDFLLTDDDGWFFLWNEADARLWRFKNQLKIEEVVEKVTMDNYDSSQLVAQFDKDTDPSGDS